MQAASAELDKVSKQFSNFKNTASCQLAAEHDKGRALRQEVAELKAQLTSAEDGRVTAEGFMRELQKSQAAHESALALKVDHVFTSPSLFFPHHFHPVFGGGMCSEQCSCRRVAGSVGS